MKENQDDLPEIKRDYLNTTIPLRRVCQIHRLQYNKLIYLAQIHGWGLRKRGPNDYDAPRRIIVPGDVDCIPKSASLAELFGVV